MNERTEHLAKLEQAVGEFDRGERTIYTLTDVLRAEIESMHWALPEQKVLFEAWQRVDRARHESLETAHDPADDSERRSGEQEAVAYFRRILKAVGDLPEPDVQALAAEQEQVWAKQVEDGTRSGRSLEWKSRRTTAIFALFMLAMLVVLIWNLIRLFSGTGP
ncbi:MAG: hypothetical protein DHS20C14_17400 [Phycisphaeraceae bacterium]|nr:MAG: hypothetical protein DHS20C14_17400 [Phycisphaeraceae bacterium]